MDTTWSQNRPSGVQNKNTLSMKIGPILSFQLWFGYASRNRWCTCGLIHTFSPFLIESTIIIGWRSQRRHQRPSGNPVHFKTIWPIGHDDFRLVIQHLGSTFGMRLLKPSKTKYLLVELTSPRRPCWALFSFWPVQWSPGMLANANVVRSKKSQGAHASETPTFLLLQMRRQTCYPHWLSARRSPISPCKFSSTKVPWQISFRSSF